MKSLRHLLPALVFLAVLAWARASSVLPLHTPELVDASDAVFRGTVVGISCFKDSMGLIYTRTSLRVDEPLKGTFPSIVQVVHRGGQVRDENDYSGLSPRFSPDGEYLLFVMRGPDGKLQCTQGHASAFPLERVGTPEPGGPEFASPGQELLDETRALAKNGPLAGSDVTDQAGSGGISQLALSGMLNNVPSRFLQPDRGQPIPYFIDADSLPSGISLTQATNAVRQAFDAWAAVTSLKFRFAGIQSFGAGADTFTSIADDFIRIQLHDNYNRITTPNVLGVGGRRAFNGALTNAGWNIGGNVASNEFHLSAAGSVVLENSNPALQNLLTLAEVLCHEIGHSLNMAHSSENPSEPNPLLNQAIMYFQAHADGRGATLGAYDPPIIRQCYPSNTPPYSFDRVMDITPASSPPNVAGINEIEMRGYDLQSPAFNLTFAVTNAAVFGGATFSVAGRLLKFTPPNSSTSPRLDPAASGYYDLIFARFSDGTNASPYYLIRVISFSRDNFPAGASDGIPDNWMISYFGDANPANGTDHRATNDFDHDTIINLNEYRAGMVPTNDTSAQRITALNGGTLQWQAKAYELYEIQGSTNLTSWTFLLPVVPTNAPIEVRTDVLATNIIASVSNLPAGNSKMFFRVLKVP